MTGSATQTFDLSGSYLDTLRRTAAKLGVSDGTALLMALEDYHGAWAKGSRSRADAELRLGGFVGEFQPGDGDHCDVHLLSDPVTVVFAPSRGCHRSRTCSTSTI